MDWEVLVAELEIVEVEVGVESAEREWRPE